MNNMENKYYIYLHIKLDSCEPFYIGKGRGKRAYSKYSRNPLWHNIVNKHGYDIIFLEENLTNDEANEKEIYWINRIGRRDLNKGPLVNLTDGGDGTINFEPWNKGKKCPSLSGSNNYFYGKNLGRKKEKHHMYNKKHKDDSKNKISDSLKEYWKDKIHPHTGKPAHNRKKVIYNGIEYDSVKSLLDSKVITRNEYYKKRNNE